LKARKQKVEENNEKTECYTSSKWENKIKTKPESHLKFSKAQITEASKTCRNQSKRMVGKFRKPSLTSV
jgi:hypothetical protein